MSAADARGTASWQAAGVRTGRRPLSSRVVFAAAISAARSSSLALASSSSSGSSNWSSRRRLRSEWGPKRSRFRAVFSNNNRFGESGLGDRLPHLASPCVDQRRRNVMPPRHLGHAGSGRECLGQNPNPIFLAPPTATLRTRKHRDLTHQPLPSAQTRAHSRPLTHRPDKAGPAGGLRSARPSRILKFQKLRRSRIQRLTVKSAGPPGCRRTAA